MMCCDGLCCGRVHGGIPDGRVWWTCVKVRRKKGAGLNRLVEETDSSCSSRAESGLRDFHLRRLSEFSSYHLVYVDESGCDKRVGFRRAGWSPRETAPMQVAHFQRGDRYQILPAYAQDGIVFAQVFQGSTDAIVFEHFIRELLPYCGRFPALKSFLIIDNATIHHLDVVKTLCHRLELDKV